MDLETEQCTHFRHDPDDPQSLSNDRVISIYEDSFGDLWVGTDRGSINSIEKLKNLYVINIITMIRIVFITTISIQCIKTNQASSGSVPMGED